MQFIRPKLDQEITYKNQTGSDVSFNGDTIKEVEQISDMYYKITVSTIVKGYHTIDVLDSDNNKIDEIIFKCVILPPELQYLFFM